MNVDSKCFAWLALILVSGAVSFHVDEDGTHDRKQAFLHASHTTVAELKVQEVLPVPTSCRCIVLIICWYILIHTALAVTKTYYELKSLTPLVIAQRTAALDSAASALTYAPVLCVLFIACRMRVEFLSNGYGEPPLWVQGCMYAVTAAVIASSALMLVVPWFAGTVAHLNDGARNLDVQRSQLLSPRSPRMPTPRNDDMRQALDDGSRGSRYTYYTLTAVRYTILICLHGGVVGIIVGTYTYLPPGTTDLRQVPSPAPAIMCTMVLAATFFVTQIVIGACEAYNEFTGVNRFSSHVHKTIRVMNAAAGSVEFAPMVAIVFLASRMRALQHDSEPQEWAQHCMYAATAALMLSVLTSILVPLTINCQTEFQASTGEVRHVITEPTPLCSVIMVALRLICLIGLYAGVIGVVISIFTFQAPAGYLTRPLSPTVRCVVCLACQFFFVYTVSICCHTISEFSDGKVPLTKYSFYAAVDAARSTLAWAPILAVLFVATRMYALLLTNGYGAPQPWVQLAMYLSTCSLLISFSSCLVTGMFVQVKTDETGNVISKFGNDSINVAMTVLRYATMLLLYGGAVTIMYGLFTLTPATARSRY